MKGGFISHHNKSRSIKKSFCKGLIRRFKCLHVSNIRSSSGQIQLEFTIESQSTTVKSFKIYAVNHETRNVHNPLQLYEVSNCHLFVNYCTNNWKNWQSLAAVYIAWEEMACRKMSHMHVILIAGVSYNTQIMTLKILANCYVFMF